MHEGEWSGPGASIDPLISVILRAPFPLSQAGSPALRAPRNISAAELQALVAHEIGHDYFWRDFEAAFARSDKNGLQELELRCDGIAVLTLIALRFDPVTLTDGLRNLARLNNLIGATANADEYPPVRQRERFIKAFHERYRVFQQPIGPNR